MSQSWNLDSRGFQGVWLRWILCSVTCFVFPLAKGHAAEGRNRQVSQLSESLTLTQPPISTQSKQSKARKRPRKQVDALNFFVSQESFIERTKTPSEVGDYTQIGARLRAQSEGQPFTGALELGGMFATNVEKYTMIEVPEAYLGWGRRSQAEYDSENTHGEFRAVLGRKLETWSALDSNWDLGLWQPLNRFDGLRSTEQGLTGLFMGWSFGQFDILAFGSSIYVPEQGPPFELQNGRFFTHSPWFSAPNDSMLLLSETTQVKYNLETPSAGSVINHPSGGLMLRFGDARDEGFNGRVAWMRKPRNSLSLPYEGHLELTDSTSYTMVSVRPQVIYHSLASADFGYRFRYVGFGISSLHELVDEDQVPDDFNHQKLAPLQMVSPHIEGKIFPSQFWGPRVRLAYLHSFGGEASSEGPMAGVKDVFAPRVNVSQAMGLTVRTMLLRSGQWYLENQTKWIEEFVQEGTILMTDLQLSMGDAWQAAVSGDFLASRKSPDDNSSFIAKYRGNDRVGARVTYFF